MNTLTTIAPWQLLAAVGVLLIIAEIFVPGFVLLPIGVGFLITAGASFAVTGWPALLAILAASLVGTFGVFHGVLKKYHAKTRAYTGAEGMIGAECVVTEAIRPGELGYVKLYGDRWQARSFAAKALKEGTRVVITKIDGNKVVVEPLA